MEENKKFEDAQEYEILIVDSSPMIQRKIKNLLYSDNYCGLCFEESTELHNLNCQFKINGEFGIHNIMLKDVIAYVLKNEIKNVAPQICTKCLGQIYNSYLFMTNTDYNLRIMYQYIDQLGLRTREVNDIDKQEKINITVHHDEISEMDTNSKSKIIVNSGFKCCKCEKVLDSFADLRIHENNHERNFRIKCKICKQPVYRRGYNEHMKVCHPDYIYSCMSCSKAFLTKKGYNYHIKQHVTHNDVLEIMQSDNSKVELSQCDLCFINMDKISLKTHKCQYSCTECDIFQCIHYKYLLACRAQMANHTQIYCPELSCKYKFKKKQQLIRHLNRDHLDYHPYTCDICKQQFYSKKSMKNHIIMYHQETYICNYCCKDFSNKKHWYKMHLLLCQDIRRKFKCSNCEASFDKKEDITDHEANCRKFKCTLCNWRFYKEYKLSEHRSKVHNGVQIVATARSYQNKLKINDNEINKCNICETQCSSRRAVVLHKRSCNTEVKCTECGKICKKGNIRAHMINNHSDEQANFACEFCGELFKRKRRLKRHVQRHTELVNCPECSKLIHQGRMSRHLNYHLTKKRQLENNTTPGIQCSQCDYKAQSLGYLDAHINQVHLKIRPFACEHCSKSFCGKYDLLKHMESHTRSKQINCEVCSLTLVNKRSYDKHMSLHTGIKPHKCDQCTEGFFSIGQLNNHKIAKHLEKCIACPISHCKAMFSVMAYMRRHFKSVHWKQKDKAFDPKEVKGLHKRYYHLFEDRRRRQIVED